MNNNNNNLSFSLDDIPDKIESKIKPGLHKLTITRCELITCKTGSKAVQFDYKLDNTDFAIKFDNCVYASPTGEQVTLGLVKLKKIILATNKGYIDDINLKIVPSITKGKSFMANISLDKDEKYLRLSDINSIKPIEEVEESSKQSIENNKQTVKEIIDTTEIKEETIVTKNW